MRDPDFGRAGRDNGRRQSIPVGMIGDDQRQFGMRLPGAGPHAHPARCKRRNRIGKTARPDFFERRGRTERHRTGEIGFLRAADAAQFAEIDAASLIEPCDLLHRAVQVDRLVEPGLADQRDDALRLAERIGADKMRAFGKECDGMQKFADFRVRIAMAKHRQAKGGFGDKDIARHKLERRTGRIGDILVIAGGDDRHVLVRDRDLRGTEHMAGRMTAHCHAIERDTLAVSDRLRAARKVFAIAERHDGERFRRRQHMAVAGAGMIGMAMRNDGLVHGPRRVDMKAGALAAHAGRCGRQEIFGPHRV